MSFSHSHALLHGAPFVRWSDCRGVRECSSGGGGGVRECSSAGEGSLARWRLSLPDTRPSWRRLFLRRQLLSLSLDADTELRAGHGRGAGGGAGGSAGGPGAVLCVALERGRDRLLLSGGLDGRVCLYRLDTPPSPTPSLPHSLAHSLVAGGGGARRAKTVIHPVATSSLAAEQDGHCGAVTSVLWYPEDPPGAFLSSSVDGSLLVWDTENFEVAGSFQLGSKVLVAKINDSVHSGLVACGTEKHGIRLCDLRTGDAVHAIVVPVAGSERSGGSCVKALDWSPSGDGHILAAGSADGCVRLWDTRKGGSAERSYLMSFDTEQDDHLTSCEEDDTKSFRKRSRNGDSSEETSSIDFSARRKMDSLISTASSSAGGTLFNSSLQARVRRREHSRAANQAVDWSREGAAVAHRGTDVVALKYSPSGAHLISCGNDGQVKMWASSTGRMCPVNFSPACCKTQLRFDIDIVSVGGAGDDVLFYPQRAHAGGMNAGHVAMTPLLSHSGESIATLEGHVNDVTAIQLSYDKSRLITAGKDGMIFLWKSEWKACEGLRIDNSVPNSRAYGRRDGVALDDYGWQSEDDEG